MICNESRIEINDDEYVDGFRDNLSSCVNKSGIKVNCNILLVGYTVKVIWLIFFTFLLSYIYKKRVIHHTMKVHITKEVVSRLGCW